MEGQYFDCSARFVRVVQQPRRMGSAGAQRASGGLRAFVLVLRVGRSLLQELSSEDWAERMGRPAPRLDALCSVCNYGRACSCGARDALKVPCHAAWMLYGGTAYPCVTLVPGKLFIWVSRLSLSLKSGWLQATVCVPPSRTGRECLCCWGWVLGAVGCAAAADSAPLKPVETCHGPTSNGGAVAVHAASFVGAVTLRVFVSLFAYFASLLRFV